jgi:hypothetical protein
MAGDWIKMRIDLRDEPEVIQIAAETNLDEDAVVGKLHCIWGWANKTSRLGNAPGVTVAWLDRYVSVTGFAQAMANAGWLHIKGDGFSFPKYDRHNSQSAKRRALTANRMKRKRDADAVTGASPEKRREEKRPPPPTPSVPGDPEANGWLEVEVRLRELKLGDAAAAVRTAKDRNLTVAYVQAIIAHYTLNDGAWDPGALHWRIQHASANDDPASMWPEASERYQQQQASLSAGERNREVRQSDSEARQQLKQDEREAKKLEDAAGKQLDAMSDDDAERLARVVLNKAALTLFLKSGRSSPLARPALLEYLANEQKPKT